jgi:elongation factor Ts
VKEVAMHIAAADPKWVRREEVPADAIEKEKSIYLAQMENSGKPAQVLEKIVEGKLGSFYSQFVLLEQPSIRDSSVSIAQVVAEASAKTGENIQISRFVRYRLGDTE